MKYLSKEPFSVGGSGKDYRDNYDRIFGLRCEECDAKGAATHGAYTWCSLCALKATVAVLERKKKP